MCACLLVHTSERGGSSSNLLTRAKTIPTRRHSNLIKLRITFPAESRPEWKIDFRLQVVEQDYGLATLYNCHVCKHKMYVVFSKVARRKFKWKLYYFIKCFEVKFCSYTRNFMVKTSNNPLFIFLNWFFIYLIFKSEKF